MWPKQQKSVAPTALAHPDAEHASTGHATVWDRTDLPEGTFKFLTLPAELRELIYIHAIGDIVPVDTAATPGSRDHLTIPVMAQLNRQTRDEALHCLYKHRPVAVSLHSAVNVRYALLWARRLGDHAKVYSKIIFKGRIAAAQNDFFHLTLACADEKPFFRLRARPAASLQADMVIKTMKDDTMKFLDEKLARSKAGQEGALSRQDVVKLINMLKDKAALRYPQP
jgi:hypothetical protein